MTAAPPLRDRTPRHVVRTAVAAAAVGTLALGIGVPAASAQGSGEASVLVVGSPDGWASTNGGTTGGAGGQVVTARSASELAQHANAGGARVIQIEGSLRVSGMVRVGSDKTIIGVGGNATISGGGLNISGARNVIVQNIRFTGAADDAINVQESSRNIWIDHNSFTGAYDGAVDIKRQSDFVTVSWNHFYAQDKTALLGHSDDATEDRGKLRVTYHHNFFDRTGSRHPRVRFSGHTHVYNNYYRAVREYGVASTEGANVLVEANHFEDVRTPTEVGYADSGPGNLAERNNVFVRSGAPQTGGRVGAPGYSYRADDARSIPGIVTAGAGVGKAGTTPPVTTPPVTTPPVTTPPVTTPPVTTPPTTPPVTTPPPAPAPSCRWWQWWCRF